MQSLKSVKKLNNQNKTPNIETQKRTIKGIENKTLLLDYTTYQEVLDFLNGCGSIGLGKEVVIQPQFKSGSFIYVLAVRDIKEVF